jgi:hypothetical protein
MDTMSMENNQVQSQKRAWGSIGLVILMLNACSFREPYPQEWAALKDVPGDCPNIAGTFYDFGQIDPESAKTTGAIWRHASLIGAVSRSRKAASATHVVIAQPDGEHLTFVAWQDEALLETMTYSRRNGDYKCEAGFVRFDTSEGWFGDPGGEVMGYEKGSNSFGKSEDGALIMRTESGGFGLVYLFIPAAVSESHWYRFEPKRD